MSKKIAIKQLIQSFDSNLKRAPFQQIRSNVDNYHKLETNLRNMRSPFRHPNF